MMQVILAFIFLLFFNSILFILAGDWQWREGWAHSIIMFVGSFGIVLYLYMKDPGLLNERFKSGIQEGQSTFDKIILIIFVLTFTAWFIIMPLDARRFRWSPEFPFWLKAIGAVSYTLTFVIFLFTFRQNTFAAPVVKIQQERGQKVISTGLYGIVRHPLYGGAIFWLLGAPLMLGSVCGIVLGFVMIVTLAVRSIGEEETLKQGLEGYEAYMKKVRWRFIPYIF